MKNAGVNAEEITEFPSYEKYDICFSLLFPLINMSRIFALFLIWMVFFSMLSAQNSSDVPSWPPKEICWIQQRPADAPKLERKIRQARQLPAAREVMENWVDNQQDLGFAEAVLSDFQLYGDTLRVGLWKGQQYHYSALEPPGLPASYLNRYDLDQLAAKEERVNWENLNHSLDQVINDYQNEGYPFARFYQRRVIYQPGEESGEVAVRVHYEFDPGPYTPIDTIIFLGNPREKPSFIFNLARIRPGDPYQEQLVADLPRLLNNSIYYEQVQAPEVTFLPYQGAQVQVQLKKAQTSRFNLLLGLLPPLDQSQRLQFTGVLDLVLVSPFRLGEILALEYNQLPSTSQRLNLEVKLPYLLRIPIRAQGRFTLLKQEVDFLNLEYEAGLEYGFSPNLSARFRVDGRNTRLLDSTLRDTSNLTPDQLDGQRQLFGLGLHYERLDYRFNPSKGIDASIDLGLGNRRIRPNLRFSEEVYENLLLNQAAQEIKLSVKAYWPLSPRQVIHLANQSYWLGLTQYLRNDQLQIGGARSLRGFNENQFFTDLMSFMTLEYRFQLERDSYLFAFFDAAYLRDRVRDEEIYPIGTGIGMNYGTKAGILSIIYAVGRTADIPFQPARGKIHVGLINRF